MNLTEYLDTEQILYELVPHKPAYTAEQLARVENLPAPQIAKTVVVEADGRFFLCVLPADRKLDFLALQKHLKANQVRLVDEDQMALLFLDAEVGAEPPFGNLYNLPTLLDKSLAKNKEISFLAGTHNASIHMQIEDYLRLVQPTILKFSYPAQTERDLDPYFFDPFSNNPFLL
ncbi:MAG TPA: YbaK/EbsC family protein [Anaerohalosphaeraceae bacterium]|jgi:Ala-tRNA(Pro) deacylase|nr:YbaK/EbsC family protein [Anaerohalosphaeraceae bacterium]HQG06034.1 YbaK/EbsC family protein [Anaerohalosphaeraceae bacterium]HQI07551.1 YbaK/EbsC family protein [Anaerohalosphaeraceae bacterium]HQJ67743.1 YbaK/EbsC family protein [Anaerohalosphaeraceae bacterium]